LGEDSNCSDTEEEDSIASIKAKIPEVESEIEKVLGDLLKIDDLVKQV
jgi:hypothetical protein